jgi:hypothetical protein
MKQILILVVACTVHAASYYISFSSGSNSNNGTSTSTPWKSHPYMQAGSGCTGSGSAPTYSHSAGDQFIFKAGDTWPNACFQMTIAAGGSSGNPDVYTYSNSWGIPGGTTGNTGQVVGAYKFDAGGSLITGGGVNRFIYNNGNQYVTINGLELTGMTWGSGTPAYGNGFGIHIVTTQNFIVSNCWMHGWTHPGATVDLFAGVVGNGGTPFNAGSRVTGCVFDGMGASDSGEAVYAIPLLDNNIVRNMSNGLLTGMNARVYNNQIGPINASFDATDHENCIEPIVLPAGQTSTNYIYNNYSHDCTAVNILTQGAPPSSGAEVDYVFNNILDAGSTVSPPIPLQFDSISTSNSSSQVYAWNNTILSGSNPCLRTADRGNGNFGVLDIRNNLCVSGTNTLALLQITGNTVTNSNNVTGTTSGAVGLGSSYQLLSGSSAIGAGANLTSQGITPLNFDAAGIPRPATGRLWDIGAYQFRTVYQNSFLAPLNSVIIK